MSTAPKGMAIRSVAAYAPPDRKTNDWIADRLRLARTSYRDQLGRDLTDDESESFMTNDRWIRRFIGFSERRFVADGEGTIDLAVNAAKLLIRGGLDPSTIDYVVFSTVTPSYLNSPPDAALLQHALGIPEESGGNPHALGGATVSLACSSWVSGLGLSYGLIRSGMAQRVLLIGADAMSTTINWRDRAFATVLGDAGTATLLESVPEEEDWFSPQGFWGWLGGSHADTIITPAGGSRVPLHPDDVVAYRNCLSMKGRLVKELIVPFVGGPAVIAALTKAGLSFSDIELAVLHEANLALNAKIIESWRTQGFGGTVLDAGGLFGNTTSASIPLVLALHASQLTVGRRFGLFAFGGGLSAAFALGQVKHPITAYTDI